MVDFLLEIGLEEIPARMIAGAETELGRRVNDLLARERLLATVTKLTTYSTPRRLAVLVEGVLPKQADTEEQLTGPSWKVAFNEDAPTAAAEAFARRAGVEVTALKKVTTAKGEYVSAKVKRPGKMTADLLAGELTREVMGLYWAKNMYWRPGKPERFVRPVRWVVALLGAKVVPLEIAGIAAGKRSRGHRILYGDKPVVIDQARNYAEKLRAANVMVDVAERRQTIRKALDEATRTVADARWREDEPLLETVVHLTEWPTVVLGDFEPEYLALPEEVLVTVMRDHQKYFAVEGADGKLAPHFLAVLNTQVDDEGREIIRHGNARVLTARFKDARFFWDFDQKTPLSKRVESLKNVTFQKELGSYYWKTEANLRLAKEYVESYTVYVWDASDPDLGMVVETAVELAKTDLTCELVKEFTELQGIVGGVYALAQGLGERVSQAIYWQYCPANTEDRIPPTVEGQILGLADRLQTIVSMFAIGNAPTGSKDPFALRRAANGVIKILAESKLPFGLEHVILPAVKAVEICSVDTLEQDVRAFFHERLHFYLRDVRGFAYDVVNAVLAAGSDDVRDAIARAEALTEVRGSEDFKAVSAACKRIKNILRQAEEKQFAIGSVNDVRLSLEAWQLSAAAAVLAPEVARLRQEGNYVEALRAIATLRPDVDAFFDKVMVLDEDSAVRGAHLGLIEGVLRGFSGIADFSEIVTA
jgi:glycyl-tRNA synthetase beta chain